MPLPGAFTSPRPRSASASRPSRSSSGRVVLVRSKPARRPRPGIAVIRLARQAALLEHDTLAELGAEPDEAARTSVPLAVNADSLATWFLEPLARLSQRHPVVFELHRDDQDFTAGLLESGTVMGAVTSRAMPVAGCRVSTLGAMRYEAVATPAFVARWLLAGWPRRCRPRPSWTSIAGTICRTSGCRRRASIPDLPPRHYVPASSDFATAVRLGLGWALLPRFQADGRLERGELVALGGRAIDVPLYWQQWNLRSALLDAIADEVVAEGRRVLRPVETG